MFEEVAKLVLYRNLEKDGILFDNSLKLINGFLAQKPVAAMAQSKQNWSYQSTYHCEAVAVPLTVIITQVSILEMRVCK